MASKRNVKKDIEYITYTVVYDCMSHLEIASEKTYEDVVKIISETVQTRNELFFKVNHQEKGSRKLVRAYYRDVYKDLLKNADSAFESLSKIITKK